MNYDNMNKEKLIRILQQKDNMLRKLWLENEKLNHSAGVDVMTGALNRKLGLELLDQELKLSSINDRNLVVCFIDVDGLKIINDTFGHEEGDKLLISLTKILKEVVRKTDFIIRMGGDEFLVVFPETIMKEADKAMMRIFKLIQETNKSNKNFNLSFSYGLYEYRKEKKLTINDLIKRADIEMYKMKRKIRRIYTICIEK